MRSSVRWIIWIVAIASLLPFSPGCEKDKPTKPAPQPETIILPTTKVLSDDVEGALTHSSLGGDTLVFAITEAQLGFVKGDVIVSDKGYGLLRKIRQIKAEQGSVTVLTDKAVLTDAIEKGSIDLIKTLGPGDIMGFSPLCDGVSLDVPASVQTTIEVLLSDVVVYDDDRDPETTDDQVTLDGSLRLTPTVECHLQIDGLSIRCFYFKLAADPSLEVKVKCGVTLAELDESTEIARFHFHPIIIPVGLVPIVFTPVLTVNAGVRGSIVAQIEMEDRMDADFAVGVKCENGLWSVFGEHSEQFGFTPPHFNYECTFNAYVGLRKHLLLYGIIGPYSEGSLFGEADVMPLEDPWWEIWGGLEFGAGARVEILGATIGEYHRPQILQVRILIAQAQASPGTLRGLVLDAVTRQPLPGASIAVLLGQTTVASGQTGQDGTYALSVPAGDDYAIRVSKSGFLDALYNDVDIESGGDLYLETILQIDTQHGGLGSVGGTIVDAINGGGIEGATIALRAGINQRTGPIVASVQSGYGGVYVFADLPAGNYTVEASKTGYVTSYFSLVCIGGQSTGDQNGTLTPVLPEGEVRIVLTWGDDPWDLDSHLTGPLPGGERFHMFFIWADDVLGSPWPAIVNLDLDDVQSYGPETTTLHQQTAGVYRFSVHDFSNRMSSSSTALSRSGALVRVYRGNGQIASYPVPAATGGTLWTVFEMEGGVLRPVNRMSYEEDPEGVTKRILGSRSAGNPKLGAARVASQ